ncbi:LysR family transcriptional regulator [Teichococcus oryzae]|uniref:Uncharacterized protein n=1 Tax=Teichococcus oryzae TaxID=1608942 RepID=A0A5B2TGW3_9PROT|nr:hypothetical protein [Pseudoroseomonas oryzae]KAA2213020.1 hypothetical protein F0Q34_12930 [Pseudoroseomonas oryzae]
MPPAEHYGTAGREGVIVLPISTELVTPLCALALAPSIRSARDLYNQVLIESDNKKLRWPAWFAANGLAAPARRGPRFEHSFFLVFR